MEEHWIEQIRNRFEQREIAPPENLWNDICDVMEGKTANNNQANHDKGKKAGTVMSIRKTLSVAAAIAIVVGVFFWFSKQTNSSDIYQDNNSVSHNSGETNKRNVLENIVVSNKINETIGSAKRYMALRQKVIKDEITAFADSNDKISNDSIERLSQDNNVINELPKAEKKKNIPNKSLNNGNRRDNSNILLANNNYIKHGNRVTVGINMSGIAAMGNSSGAGNGKGQLSTMSDPISGNMPGVSLLSAVNNIKNDPSLNVKTKHHYPIKVGLSVGWGISNRLTLLSGVNYSYLSSEKTVGGIDAGYKEEQNLHYVGVPMAISFKIWNNRKLSVYATGGTEVDFCVSGKAEKTHYSASSVVSSSKENVKDNKPQWSVNATAGVQYDISKQWGVFLEPGIGYFFDNGSSVDNIYKDKPFNINLNVGFRLNVNK